MAKNAKKTREKEGCGGGTFERMSPKAVWESGGDERKIYSFEFTYEEALKLLLSLQDCLLRLNRTNFATTEGQRVRATLAFKLRTNRVDVLETKAAKKPRN